MMKNIFLYLLLPLFGFGQEAKPLSYSEVINVDSVPKDELFQRAREWVTETYRSANDVLQVNDKESGELSGKAITDMYVKRQPYESRYHFSIFVKDGKYKYEFTQFIAASASEHQTTIGLLTTSEECPYSWPMVSKKKMNEIYTGIKEGVDIKIQSLITSLKEKMSSKSKKDF